MMQTKGAHRVFQSAMSIFCPETPAQPDCEQLACRRKMRTRRPGGFSTSFDREKTKQPAGSPNE
jgi:hypothetical protein